MYVCMYVCLPREDRAAQLAADQRRRGLAHSLNYNEDDNNNNNDNQTHI